MTMHTVYLKEHEGIVQNPTGHLSSGAAVPWWSGRGSQSPYSESFGQLKSSSLGHHANGVQLTTTKQAGCDNEQELEKGNTTQFTIFPGDCKTSANTTLQSAPPEYRGRFELGFGQPVICAKYPFGDQCYGVFSTYGPQIPVGYMNPILPLSGLGTGCEESPLSKSQNPKGRIMLPLNLTTDDGPIYVNAKQYHGIIRRRLSRAKAESDNKALRNRKPYLHLSRHLHAMRRPRGGGGRFLNTKTSNGGKDGTETEKNRNGHLSQPTESQCSEVLQSDGGNSNSPKKANGSRSNISGSEVTSIFSRGDLDRFAFSHLPPSVHSLSDMMNTGHGMVVPSKWI